MDVPPVLGAPFWCEEHGDVDITEVSVFGVKDFFVLDTEGNWHNREGDIVEEAELITLLEQLKREDYEVLPFSISLPYTFVVVK